MEIKARLESIDRVMGKTTFTLSTDSKTAAEELEQMADRELRVKVVRYRKPRSLNANALFWHCVDEIAGAVGTDRWSVYLDMLRQYGKSTYICVKPTMVEHVKKQWRECVELGMVVINGKPAKQMQVFFGSSTYDTAEMSRLIDGTIDTMKELGLPLPIPKDVQMALEEWNGQHYSD